MSKASQRKREKKQKAERKRRLAQPVSLAYTGSKYKSDALVPLHFCTETAVYECFVITRRKLTDHHVRAALERLIAELRRGPLPEWNPDAPLRLTAGGEVDLVVANIRRAWCDFLAGNPNPGRDNTIGVLRTILGSIECWSSISPQSRGYLQFIGGFCNKLGVEVTPVAPSELEEGALPLLDAPLRESP